MIPHASVVQAQLSCVPAALEEAVAGGFCILGLNRQAMDSATAGLWIPVKCDRSSLCCRRVLRRDEPGRVGRRPERHHADSSGSRRRLQLCRRRLRPAVAADPRVRCAASLLTCFSVLAVSVALDLLLTLPSECLMLSERCSDGLWRCMPPEDLSDWLSPLRFAPTDSS